MLISFDGYDIRSGTDKGVEWIGVSGGATVVNPTIPMQGDNKAPPGNRSMQVPAAMFRAAGAARVGGALYAAACTCSLR